MNSVKLNKVIVLFDQALFSGTNFILTLLLAKRCSPESFGQYSAYVLATYLALTIISAWTTQPFQVLFSRTANVNEYRSFLIWLQTLLILSGLVLVQVATAFFPIPIPTPVVYFSIGILFNDFTRKLLLTFAPPLYTLIHDSACSVLLMYILITSPSILNTDLLNTMRFLGIAYLLPSLVILIYLKPHFLTWQTTKSYLHSHIKEGKWLFLTALSQWWNSNLFMVATGSFLGIAALGALRLAQSLLGVFNMLLQLFENYILPQTASKLNDNTDKGIRYIISINRKAGLFFLPALLFIFLFADHLIAIAGGGNFPEASFVLKWLCILYAIIYLSQPTRAMIRALLLSQHFFYGYLLSLIISLISYRFLLARFGLNGAIMGLILSQIVLTSYWTFVLNTKKIKLWKSFISF